MYNVQYIQSSGLGTVASFLQDSLLVAIREDYVDGVDTLLRFEEEHHKEGQPYSWEAIDQVTANFTPDITPLILAGES